MNGSGRGQSRRQWRWQGLPSAIKAVLSSGARPRRWLIPSLVIAAVSSAVMTSVLGLARSSYRAFALDQPMRRPLNAALRQVVSALPAGSSFGSLSLRMNDGFPLALDLNRSWAFRYPFLLPLPALANASPEALKDQANPLSWAARSLRETIAHDLVTNKPTVVFVDRTPVMWHIKQQNFDIVGFLSADPKFVAEWAHYRVDSRIDLPAARVDVYRRVD